MSFGFRVSSSGFLAVAAIFVLGSISNFAQSSDQNFPTPLTTNEIDGTIKARDMGDPRATTYFYAFDGGQGDIFINAVTKNFSGDIDVFTVDTMTPLAKMVVYAGDGPNETGRLIYLRKPERLILRVEGRTPNDDAATFRIKFGGSFIALAAQKQEEAPTVAKNDPNEPGIKVDSIGRIVAIVPKPQPTAKIVEPPPVKETTVAKSETPVSKTTTAKAPTKPGATVRNATVKERAPAKPKKPAETGTVYENETAKVTVVPEPKSEPPASAGGQPVKPKTTPGAKKPIPAKTTPKKPPETTTAAGDTQAGTLRSDKPDALASIRLVIQMKDGTVFWLPMNKVAKFTVDKGVMTVTAKDGSVTRYNILEVVKTTIQ